MTTQLSPQPLFQAFAPNGGFLVGGKLFTYAAGTSTPQATYIDSTQTTPNTNPVILNSLGQASVWLNPLQTYKFVLQDSAGNPQWSVDQIAFSTAAVIGAILFPKTPIEIAAGTTPTAYQYEPYDVRRYGADQTGGIDSTAAFNQSPNATFVFPGTYLTNSPVTAGKPIISYNASFIGASPVNAFMPNFGANDFTVMEFLGGNAIVGAINNSLAINTTAFPTGVTGYGRNNNTGNQAFGLFGRADQYALTGVVSNEVNSFNWTGVAASSNLPPNRGIGTTQNLPVALTVAAGGNASSAIGIHIAPEGGTNQQFITGMYCTWNTVQQYGQFWDALLNDTFTTAVLKHSANQNCLQLIGVGTMTGTVSITGVAGQFSVTATNLAVGMQVKVSGALTGTGTITGYANPTTYQISATNGSTTFTLQTLVGGAIVTTAGTTTGLTFAATVPGGAVLQYTDATGTQQYKVAQNGYVTVGTTQVLQKQITGYGTPTGAAYQPSFAAGAITLPNLAAAVAQMILDLKTHGMIGT